MALEDVLTTRELLELNAKRDALAKKKARQNERHARKRGPGLRLRLSRTYATKGKARKVLRTPYRFQCPPLEEFTVPTQRSLNRWVNYKGTEFVGRGGMQLRQITFRTLAVEYGSFVVEFDFNVDRLVNDLKKLVVAGYPFDLLATHNYNQRPELHNTVLLESVGVTEQSGESDAKYLDLTFVQWREGGVDRNQLRPGDWPKYLRLDKDGKRWDTDLKVPGVFAKKTDANEWTFADVARVAYGKPSLAREVARAQKPTFKDFGMHTPIMKHPKYKKGGKIRIPEPPARGTFDPPTGGAFVYPQRVVDLNTEDHSEVVEG